MDTILGIVLVNNSGFVPSIRKNKYRKNVYRTI